MHEWSVLSDFHDLFIIFTFLTSFIIILLQVFLPMIEQRFPEQRFPENGDCDDAANGEMLFNRERVYDSQREGLLVGQSSSSTSDGATRC